jgi:hypothetical protein
VSADHGQQPLPELFGGWRINSSELERDVEARFGDDIVEKVTTVDLFMNMDRVEDAGVSLAEVARFIGTYTLGDNIPEDQPGAERVPEDLRDETLFAGAFSTGYLQGLDTDRIESFGPGDYPEGELIFGGPNEPEE